MNNHSSDDSNEELALRDHPTERGDAFEIELPVIKCPPLAQAGDNPTPEQINRQHLQMSNLEINVIYALWPQVTSITAVCRLIDASIKAVKHQRDILCMPYGYKGTSTREDISFPPLED